MKGDHYIIENQPRWVQDRIRALEQALLFYAEQGHHEWLTHRHGVGDDLHTHTASLVDEDGGRLARAVLRNED